MSIAPRRWLVEPDDTPLLTRSLALIQLSGRFPFGGVFQVAVATGETPWVFEWRDLSPDDEAFKPKWDVPAEDEELLDSSHQMVELVTEFFGGAFTTGGIREELPNGEYATIGYAFQWQSYLPVLKPAVEAEPAENGAGEPEPVAG